MNFHTIKWLFATSLFCISFHVQAAETVMIIPFYKEGENRRIIIESDPCYRTLETKIKEVFLKTEGYGLIDYLAAVKKAKIDKMYTESTDLKTLLLQQENPDVYIIADMEKMHHNGYEGLYINLTAYVTSTSRTIGAVSLDSGFRKYNDCQSLIGKACMETDANGLSKLEVLVQQIKDGIDRSTKGIPIFLQFSLAEECMYDFYSEVANDDSVLIEHILKYVEENTVDGLASPSAGDKMLKFSEVLIPSRLADGKPNTAMKFALDFRRYLSKLSPADEPQNKFSFKPDVRRNNVYFTLYE